MQLPLANISQLWHLQHLVGSNRSQALPPQLQSSLSQFLVFYSSETSGLGPQSLHTSTLLSSRLLVGWFIKLCLHCSTTFLVQSSKIFHIPPNVCHKNSILPSIKVCTGYFSIAVMINTMTKNKNKKPIEERICLGLWFQRAGVHNCGAKP